MKKQLALLFLLISFGIHAQNNFKAYIQLGPKMEVWKTSVDDPYFFKSTTPTTMPLAFGVGYELKKNLWLSLGFNRMEYYEVVGTEFFGSKASNITSAMLLYQVPVSLSYNFIIDESRWSIEPKLAAVFGYNDDYGHYIDGTEYNGVGEGTFYNLNGSAEFDSVTFKSYSSNSYQEYFVNLEVGASINYQVGVNSEVSLGYSFVKGFSTFAKYDVIYAVDDGPEKTVSFTSDGSWHWINFKYAYRFSFKKKVQG